MGFLFMILMIYSHEMCIFMGNIVTMKEIPLTHGKVALVDDCDFDRLIAMGKWHFSAYGYAAKNDYVVLKNGKKAQTIIYMHRIIINAPKGTDVDHCDHQRLNNQRSNLRICTRSQNKMNIKGQANNTSGFKGVSWRKDINKWRARVNVDGKEINLGCFSDKIEAARVYNASALKYHGEFACLNQIPI